MCFIHIQGHIVMSISLGSMPVLDVYISLSVYVHFSIYICLSICLTWNLCPSYTSYLESTIYIHIRIYIHLEIYVHLGIYIMLESKSFSGSILRPVLLGICSSWGFLLRSMLASEPHLVLGVYINLRIRLFQDLCLSQYRNYS